jgi:predicted amidohydrolase YtcJ
VLNRLRTARREAAHRPSGGTMHKRSLVLAAGVALGAASSAQAAQPADTVLRNGYVYTVDPHDSVRQAVAVRDGRIVFVGSDRGVRRYIGPRTRVRDVKGKMVMPGLQDGHMHPLGGGAGLLKCSLDYQPLTVEQFKTRIAKCLADTTDKEPDTWLEVISWYQEAMIPAGTKVTKGDLDALSTKRPIIVQSSFGHSTVVNSRALALAGITAATADPPGGKIWRDAAGNPTGLLDDAAQDLVSNAVPVATAADDVNSAKAALDAMRRQGITSFLDAAASPSSLTAFSALSERGDLTARAHFAPVVDISEGKRPAAVVKRLRGLARRYDQGAVVRRPAVTLRNAKLFMDGVQQVPAQTAGLLKPYLINAGTAEAPSWVPGPSRGPIYFEPSILNPLVAAIARAGFDPHIHSIGDRAVRLTLDAYANMRKQIGRRDIRPAIAHAEMVDPADYGRFRKLGVIPAMSFQWAKPGPDSIDAQKDYIGPERFSRVEPEGSLYAAGAPISYGSDWPVDTLNEWFALQVGITRQNPAGGKYAGRFNDQKGLPRRFALRAITMNSAYELHQDRQTGSLEPGKYADLIVLDRNVLKVPATDIMNTKVLLTMVGGRTVYDTKGR